MGFFVIGFMILGLGVMGSMTIGKLFDTKMNPRLVYSSIKRKKKQ